MTAIKTTSDVGTEIGQAIARDVIADNMPREWTGLDAQDADQIPDGMNRDEVEAAAEEAYDEAIKVHEIGCVLAAHGPAFDGGSEVSRAEIAREWSEDFTVAEVGDWTSIGVWDAGTAASLRSANLTTRRVKDAAEQMIDDNGADDYTDGDPVYSACNGDTDVQDIIDAAQS